MLEIILLGLWLGIASFRVTRFLVIDTLFQGLRNKFHSFLINQSQKEGKFSLVWSKLYDLTSCTWCAGVYVSLGLYSLWMWTCPLDFGRMDWINVAAIAGIQGFLHSIEPDDA